ncbi:MAG: hypothetical protein Q4D98_12705 [Planctomycetia bacterium]|nr:hypothetical protein [Planctomycetia bacterium]
MDCTEYVKSPAAVVAPGRTGRTWGREARSESACLPVMLQSAAAVVAPGRTGSVSVGL